MATADQFYADPSALLKRFVTFDERQRQLALATGLKVVVLAA